MDLIDPDYWVVAASWYAPESVGHAYAPPAFAPQLKTALEETGDGVWIYGYSYNSIAGEGTTYVSFNKVHDNYLFGRGYTYPAEDKVRTIVEDTIKLYDSEEGREIAFGQITQESLYPHYAFVVDPETENIVAHGASPDRVGTKSVFFSDTIERSSDDILADLNSNGTTWVDYQFPYPDADLNATENKRALLVLHDDLIFGSGYYKSTYVVHGGLDVAAHHED